MRSDRATASRPRSSPVPATTAAPSTGPPPKPSRAAPPTRFRGPTAAGCATSSGNWPPRPGPPIRTCSPARSTCSTTARCWPRAWTAATPAPPGSMSPCRQATSIFEQVQSTVPTPGRARGPFLTPKHSIPTDCCYRPGPGPGFCFLASPVGRLTWSGRTAESRLDAVESASTSATR